MKKQVLLTVIILCSFLCFMIGGHVFTHPKIVGTFISIFYNDITDQLSIYSLFQKIIPYLSIIISSYYINRKTTQAKIKTNIDSLILVTLILMIRFTDIPIYKLINLIENTNHIGLESYYIFSSLIYLLFILIGYLVLEFLKNLSNP